MNMVSVIIPAYNAANSLRGCVESILLQSYQNIEIIIVDDGSTDETLKICDALLSRYASTHKIKVIHKANGGVSSARNAGLDVAQGDMITFVDADDALMRNGISSLMDVLNEKDIDIAVCARQKMSTSDDTIFKSAIEWTSSCCAKLLTSDEAVSGLLSGELTGSCCERVFRKEIVHGERFDESIKNNEDKLFIFHLYRHANRICVIDAPLYVQYVRMDSATHTMPYENTDKITVSERIEQELISNHASKELIELAQQHKIEMIVGKLRGLMRYKTLNDGDESRKRQRLFYEIRNHLVNCSKPSRFRSKKTNVEIAAIKMGYRFYHLFVTVADGFMKK